MERPGGGPRAPPRRGGGEPDQWRAVRASSRVTPYKQPKQKKIVNKKLIRINSPKVGDAGDCGPLPPCHGSADSLSAFDSDSRGFVPSNTDANGLICDGRVSQADDDNRTVAGVDLPETEERLRNMFLQMQPAFHRHAPKSRTNFLSYSYVLYKSFQILGLHHMCDGLTLLKGRDKLFKQDTIFRKICDELHWEFLPSV